MSAISTITILDGYTTNGSFTSNIFSLDSYPTLSIHWYSDSSTAAGTWELFVSDAENARSTADGYQGGARNNDGLVSALNGNFVALASVKTFPVANGYTVQTVTGGSPKQGMISIDSCTWKWAYLQFIGTGSFVNLDIRAKGKRNF